LELHFGLVNEFHQFAAVEAFELSKALGNVRRRKLRTDDTEIMISLSRPVILNSIIQGLIEAGDLASRALVVRTKSIGDDGKTTVEGLNFEFEKNGPLIFGALLSAVSTTLKNLPNVSMTGLPRMADFSRWCNLVVL
jgi:hypothetical protein